MHLRRAFKCLALRYTLLKIWLFLCFRGFIYIIKSGFHRLNEATDQQHRSCLNHICPFWCLRNAEWDEQPRSNISYFMHIFTSPINHYTLTQSAIFSHTISAFFGVSLFFLENMYILGESFQSQRGEVWPSRSFSTCSHGESRFLCFIDKTF